ncbi:amino acid adenylation domain-containing protein, partial [Flavobacterium sp. W22_SRS_FK3]|uniref:non-ribosomal peptide synthetase n=1 Tax=Flavobacterium sp. W22_SRS_FK3 TaxID=3240275 RepID=UPI003F8EDAF1
MSTIQDPDLIEDIYPMTDVQQGMIMESLLAPNLAIFHDQLVFTINDVLFDSIIFHKAIALLIEKHSIFRTSFNFSDYDQPVQIVYKSVSFDLKNTDLSLFDRQAQEKKIEQFLEKERGISFIAKQVPLYRFDIFSIAEYNKLFIFQFHHSIMDGWSVASFITELYKTYFELKEGISYLPSIIACNQRDSIISELIAKQDVDAIAFWKEKLSGYKKLDILKEETEISEQYTKQYDLSFLNDLKKQCKQYNLTLKTVLFGAYIYALKMLTNENELTVGLVANNRPSIEDGENILGCFLNMLPVRYTFQSEENWLQYFKNVEEKIKEVQLNSHLTFFEIKRHVGLNKNDSFFDVLFNYIDFHVYNEIISENSLTDNLQSGNEANINEGLNISSFERTSSSLNLTVDLTGNKDLKLGYKLYKNFKSEISLEHFHTYIDTILCCFKDKFDAPVDMESILLEEESHQLLEVFNATSIDYPKDKTIVDLFTEQVKRTPNAIAVVYEDKKLSYKELNERSNQLGHYLREQGVQPDDLVGICLERSLEMLVGILGILKSGGAYVPIDPEYPSGRIDYMLKDAGIGLVLSSGVSSKVISKDEDLSVLCLDKDWDNILGYPTSELENVLTASNLAYVIYTSGSTGIPKGVMNEHGGIVNRLLWGQSHYQLKSDEAILQKTSFSFDVSVWEFLWTISCGARLVFAKPEGHKDAEYLKYIIEKENITTIHFVPSMLRVFLENIKSGDCNSLKRVLCSGEALQVDQVLLFKDKFKDVRLDNLYGPTEAAIEVSSWKVPLKGSISQVLMGKPVANTSLYVLDNQNQLLPIGVIGELCIGGVQVARGYLNREELTREKFIANP